MAESSDNGLVWEVNTKATPRFGGYDGYFQLNRVKDAPESKCVDTVAAELNKAANAIDGEELPAEPSRQRRIVDTRQVYVKRLSQIAKAFSSDGALVAGKTNQIVKDIGQALGEYIASRRMIDSRQAVEIDTSDDPHSLRPLPLPPGATPQQQELIVSAIRAATVVDVVLTRRATEEPLTLLGKYLARIGNQRDPDKERREKRHNEVRMMYLRELKDIADEGVYSEVGGVYAQHRLDAFKDDFVSREADAVKNAYIKRLGLWAIRIGFPLLIGAAILHAAILRFHLSPHAGVLPRNFLLLTSASCAGTWLSFSVRRVVLGFNDLAVLEEDRLNPAGRLIFVILLTSVLALLLETSLVGISVGQTKLLISKDGLMAVVLGALCGIAERTLSGVVAGRAEEIVGAGRRGTAPQGTAAP